MNGNIFEIKWFAVHDGPGIRTTVFLKGCPLKCKWCHNPEGITPKKQLSYLPHKCVKCGACAKMCGVHSIDGGVHTLERDKCKCCGKCTEVCFSEALKIYGTEVSAEKVAQIVLEDIAFYKNSGGGITVSGGEPLLQAEFVRELFTIVKTHGIHTAVDTCGAVSWEKFVTVLGVTDLFLYDIKHTDPIRHKYGTGMDNALILENLNRISESGKPVEIRIPLIPGYNDDDENLLKTSEILKNIKTLTKFAVLPYHEYYEPKYEAIGSKFEMFETTPPDNLTIQHAITLVS